jgi:hypothetical protein
VTGCAHRRMGVVIGLPVGLSVFKLRWLMVSVIREGHRARDGGCPLTITLDVAKSRSFS